jgi:endonuclease-8
VPEGDTIYRAARAMQTVLGGKTVTGFDTGLAKLASVHENTSLVGRIVEKVESRGKWLLIFFSGDLILTTHMLMSGSWHLYRAGEKWRMGRDHMRAVIRTPDWEAVAFNVPIAEFYTTRSIERNSQIPKLGPDVLSPDFTVANGIERLREYSALHPDTEIAVVLLNQRVLAGLGNVYKSEVAFASGVNPFRAMQTITPKEMETMVDIAQRYMKANVLDGSGDGIVTYSGNRRTTHANNREERLWVHGRQGQECRRCGALIMMRKQGGQARSTYWCPECQPWIGTEAVQSPAPVGRTDITRRRNAGC